MSHLQFGKPSCGWLFFLRRDMRGMDVADARLDLRNVLDCLTEKQAQALGLWYEGYTQEEIGEMLGVSQQAAGGLIQRGLERIRDEML